MRISDWSSDVCSSDLLERARADHRHRSMRAGPGDRHLIGADAEFVRNGDDGVESCGALRAVLGLEHIAAKALGSAFLALAILARHHADRQCTRLKSSH